MSVVEQLDEEIAAPGTFAPSRVERAGLLVLEGGAGRRRLWSILPFLGPAFVACVAYIDPGNFATNIAAGAQFGYSLLWVVLLSNLMAMLLQYLSAKLGIATGENLPETIRERWPRPISLSLWIVAEIAAMATDLAEFLGGALGFNLLFHIPLFAAGLLTGATTLAILGLQRHGVRPLEAIIVSLVGVIAACYVVETLLGRPDWGQVAYHTVVPTVSSSTILVSVGILGATVMPHVVYLHSALTQRRIRARNETEKRRLLRFNTVDVVVAMTLAGIINLAMLYVAASTFHGHGLTSVSDIRVAYHTLTPLLGNLAAIAFGVSLLASGVSSSAVGTMAGQVIMGGFVGWTIPLWVRRAVTMMPAMIVIALNLPTTQTLIISQVILSLVLPFAVGPLIWFTAQHRVMGVLTNRRVTTVLAAVCGFVIIGLNGLLLYQVAITL
jgi:manganese transport protein